MSLFKRWRNRIRDDRSRRKAAERNAETSVDRMRREFPAWTGKDQILEESESVDSLLTDEIPVVAVVDVLYGEGGL